MANFMNKPLSEEDIKNQRITPVLLEKKWKREQMRMEYAYTAGEIRVEGSLKRREKRKSIDYLLFDDENYPIAIIEAKSAKYHHSHGLQQAKNYAEELKLSKELDIPFVFSSNGEKFRMWSRYLPEVEKTLEMNEFPTLEELKKLYMEGEKYTDEQLNFINQPYYTNSDSFPPRYYQRVAINKTIEALARGQKRAMVVMATGTGKTYVAFQIIYRYLQQNPKARILYLADRNILIDQTMRQDFKPFAKIMTKVQGKKADASAQIYMSLYGQWVNYDIEESEKQPYEDFDKDFFNLIIIDECHRSSVKDDSQWKAILNYFSSATQIGMTATPRDAEGGSNIDYFGEPVFTYSLLQGIQDGFLAPYQVVKSTLSSDLEGYATEADERDLLGREIDKSLFTRQNFGRDIQIKKRQIVVAKRITEMLKTIGEMTKTIVFCPDEEEANVMRELLIDMNRAKCRKNDKYIVRITSSDRVGKNLLDDFIDPYSDYPVVATTSMLLSTGVDCKTCGLIVIDKEVGSMTTFKQMVGRGTRIHEKAGKMHFYILDFRDVTSKFFEEGFDKTTDDTNFGGGSSSGNTGGTEGGDEGGEDGTPEPRKYYVEGKEVTIVHEQVLHIGADGKLVTEKLTDFTRKAIRKHYPTLDMFRGAWRDADKKKAILDEMDDNNIWIEAIREKYPQYKDWDEFDIVCHLAFDAPPLTRQERINNVKKRNCFAKYGDEAKRIIDALLDKYAETGVVNIEDNKILDVPEFSKFGRKAKIMRLFNGLKGYEQTIQEIETEIYNIG